MLRFGICKFDMSTYIVVDRELNRELCVCNSYEGGSDFKSRAKSIANALNAGHKTAMLHKVAASAQI